MQSNARRLRDLICGPKILVLPGVFEGFSARLVQQAGYCAAFVTGAGVSESSLGWSDYGVMSYEENLRVARNLVGCCSLPMLADADTGYGNAVNVHFTVRGFERAGVAGLMLEDQVWPKRCGHMAGKEVISAEEAAGKIRAAASARQDPDFVIMARTDALATHGLHDAIERLNRYAEAGADLLFADALLSEGDVSTVVDEVHKPLCVNMGFGIRSRSTTPLVSAARLEDLGVAAVIFPRLLSAAAVKGMKNALAAFDDSLKSGSVADRPDLLASFEELIELTGVAELRQLESSFLTEDHLTGKYKS